MVVLAITPYIAPGRSSPFADRGRFFERKTSNNSNKNTVHGSDWQENTMHTSADFTRKWAVAVVVAIVGALLLLRLLSAGCQVRSDGKMHPGGVLAEHMAQRRQAVETMNAMIEGRR
jgi:hypothetical protein